MEAVYVLEPGAYLRREGRGLKVMRGGELVDRIPAEGLRRMVLVGYVTMTGAVLDFLIRNRVETVLMTPAGRFRARLMLDEDAHVLRRAAQYERLRDPEGALAAARACVFGKLENMARLLLRRRRGLKGAGLGQTAGVLREMAKQTAAMENLDALRGLEGLGTRRYFSRFDRLIRAEGFSFSGRNRRPPKDPVNALLSFVYTLLTNEVLSAIQSVGLDPYLGALHAVEYGRPSLACDLVEEFRPYMGDRLVLELINRRLVKPADFIVKPARKGDGGAPVRPVEMRPAAARKFVASYEAMMGQKREYPRLGKRLTYRSILREQARAFAEWMENPEAVWTPLLWEV
ncbi:MAG: CRISPR-associated endonuclease Cas1 [Desulfococcaceae bacterium]